MVLHLKKQYHFQQAQYIFQTFMKHTSQRGKGKLKNPNSYMILTEKLQKMYMMKERDKRRYSPKGIMLQIQCHRDISNGCGLHGTSLYEIRKYQK